MTGKKCDVFRMTLDESGRVSIPVSLRTALGVGKGDSLLAIRAGDETVLCTPEQALRKAQELIRQHIPPGIDLVGELLAERREEAARERRDP